jgi:hypothetical protein
VPFKLNLRHYNGESDLVASITGGGGGGGGRWGSPGWGRGRRRITLRACGGRAAAADRCSSAGTGAVGLLYKFNPVYP